ncbi:MAG: hypothetical protein BWX49_00161 [Bacteroidetes bacterium ADurb.Bin008]|nr:MAG: hypothetical protein BWX49_00161 [Bacteroidetes bacterium ADurb.Bin008]
MCNHFVFQMVRFKYLIHRGEELIFNLCRLEYKQAIGRNHKKKNRPGGTGAKEKLFQAELEH